MMILFLRAGTRLPACTSQVPDDWRRADFSFGHALRSWSSQVSYASAKLDVGGRTHSIGTVHCRATLLLVTCLQGTPVLASLLRYESGRAYIYHLLR